MTEGKNNSSDGPNQHLLAAELYALRALDALIDIAYAIALDFVARPRHYRSIEEKTVRILEEIKAHTGSDPDWPDGGQRAAIYAALFGSEEKGRSPIARQSVALREAAAAFAERTFDSGVAMLRQRFRDCVITLRAHLSSLSGTSVSVGHRQTMAIFQRARSVFQNPKIAAAFGLPPAPAGEWPLGESYSGDGAALVEEVSRLLRPDSMNPMPGQRLLVRQRVANYGFASLSGVADDSPGWDSDDRIDALIAHAYSWHAAIGELERG